MNIVKRLVGTLFILVFVMWVLLKLFPAAMPFLIALWLIATFSTVLFRRKEW